MPRATAGPPEAGDVRALAAVYRRYADDVAARSPLQASVAIAISDAATALEAIAAAPTRGRAPATVLAVLHELALAGRAPDLAVAYAARDGRAAAAAALSILGSTDVAAAARRPLRAFATTACAALYPAVAEAAHRAGAPAIGLVDVGGSPGLNAVVDRVGISYDNGQFLGDPVSPLQLSAAVVGGRALPDRPLPEVVARVDLAPDPLDLTDADDVRRLRSALDPERVTALDEALAVASADAPVVVRAGILDALPAAIGLVPVGALPVVVTTWALSGLRPVGRRAFRDHLVEVAGGRPVAWVSIEGVGVAPGVPDLGDRHASGHSIVGITLLDGSARDTSVRSDAVGRCWSRGRLLSWLA